MTDPKQGIDLIEQFSPSAHKRFWVAAGMIKVDRLEHFDVELTFPVPVKFHGFVSPPADVGIVYAEFDGTKHNDPRVYRALPIMFSCTFRFVNKGDARNLDVALIFWEHKA